MTRATDATETPLSILAIDDDPDFREYLATVLESEGHAARVVGAPDEFFSACEHRLPDVAMLDIKMGPHSGAAVLGEIRKRWPKLCVVILTGYPTMDSMRETFRQDVFDYVTKPFEVAQLRKVLREAADVFNLGQRSPERLRVELGRQIRLARTERGWTLKELSDAAGFSVSQLSSIERGAHLPSLDSLLAIAAALDRRPSEVLGSAGF